MFNAISRFCLNIDSRWDMTRWCGFTRGVRGLKSHIGTVYCSKFWGTSRHMDVTNANCLLRCGCSRYITHVQIRFRGRQQNLPNFVHDSGLLCSPTHNIIVFSQHNPWYIKFNVHTWHGADPPLFSLFFFFLFIFKTFELKYGGFKHLFHVL